MRETHYEKDPRRFIVAPPDAMAYFFFSFKGGELLVGESIGIREDCLGQFDVFQFI